MQTPEGHAAPQPTPPSTQAGANPDTTKGLIFDDQSPDVVAAAQGRGLGPHVVTQEARKGRSRTTALVLLVVGAASLASWALLPALASVSRGLATSVFILATAVGVVSLVLGLRMLFRGQASYHLYAGGLVYRSREKVRAALAWSDVTQIRMVPGTGAMWEGSILRFDVMSRDGRRIQVPGFPSALMKQPDHYGERLVATARGAGVTVH